MKNTTHSFHLNAAAHHHSRAPAVGVLLTNLINAWMIPRSRTQKNSGIEALVILPILHCSPTNYKISIMSASSSLLKTLALAAFVVLSVDLSGQDTETCLVADYPFNGDAVDQTGHGHDGTINGASLSTDRFGNANSAFFFDGVDDFISIPHDSFLLNEYTYSTWVSVSSTPSNRGYYCILHVGNTGGTDQVMSIANDPSFSNVGASCGSWDNTATPHSMSAGQIPNTEEWYHVAFTRDNTQAKMYVNGVAVDSLLINGVNAGYGNNPIATIGSRFTTMQYYHGKIDDVKIFDCVLSDAEVMNLFDGTTAIDPLVNGNAMSFNIYPNPASDWVSIEHGHSASVRVRVLNSHGQESFNCSLNGQSSRIDLSDKLASGFYFIQLVDASGEVFGTQKLMVN